MRDARFTVMVMILVYSVGISSEVLRVFLGVFLPHQALVVHQVLQAVPVFVKGGAIAREVVPRAPVLVQVL